MNEFDRAFVTTADGPSEDPQQAHGEEERVEAKLLQFLREYNEDNRFLYRDQLKSNLLTPEYSLTVDLRHLQSFDAALASQLVHKPNEYLNLFENAAQKLAKQVHFNAIEAEGDEANQVPPIQVMLRSAASVLAMRNLGSDHVSKIVRLSGILSSASAPSAKATKLHLFCRDCRHVKVLQVNKGFSGVQFPRQCESTPLEGKKQCPMDPYLVNTEKSTFVDQQVLKLQEAPDMVPVGEMPRHMLLTADRYLTNKIMPGARVTVVGIYDIFQRQASKHQSESMQSIRNPYLRIVGLDVESDGATRGKRTFTAEEEIKFRDLSRQPDIYNVFANSIAPSIFGNGDIKKSIACLLMGGSKKLLPDGMRLRGDINVLLLGDPGTAKSQLLKFVEKVSPISVYTSGKGSSAAGLTASVIRDPTTREFYLEGGAMVLADGGVVCIDEFDKMREEDRVAIHEAMEQQTISIAKAGITTILNSRTSVLAAANPVFGRYDDMKTPGENIDFQTTILSRFDMIYILKDEHNQARDEALAKHVMAVHGSGAAIEIAEGEMDIKTMKNFISFCKSHCAPRLSKPAAEKLASHFVEIRSQVAKYENEANARSSVPITIRQLEAIVRIAESLAKLSLSPTATEHHVDEAIRLFRVSTFAATQSGYQTGEGMMVGQTQKDLRKAEDDLRTRLPLGQKVAERTLLDFLTKRGYSDYVAQRTLHGLQMQGKVQYTHQGKFVHRVGV